MDVAKYIGLFLLKNQFCYIHGLGNLEIKKRPATYDGAALLPPQYEITVTPTGSIDDNLANFIATNEQISISKAANALRDFSTQARADLHEGKDVPIPNIGKFVEENGKVRFETDPNLQYTPRGIPALKVSKRVEEQPFQSNSRLEPLSVKPPKTAPLQSITDGNSLNWSRIIMAVIILLLIIGGCTFGYKYYKSKHNAAARQEAAALIPDTVSHQTVVNAPQVRQDSAAAAAIANTDTVKKDAAGLVSYDMILNTYSTKAKAEKRIETLKSFGHKEVQLVQDSLEYLVIVPIKCAPADTTHIMDSLKIYNPKGIRIYR
jgi:nucleoid DNA-binding protein